METADDHVFETIRLYLSPRLDLVCWDILLIACHILRGIGVASFRSDGGHHLVVLVRNIIFGCELRDRVDLMIGFLAQCGISDMTVLLKSVLNRVEQRGLCRDVAGTEMGCALEHKMFEVVSQSCRLWRIVARSGLHGDISLQAWCLVVHAHVDLQSIGEGVDARVHRVARHC